MVWATRNRAPERIIAEKAGKHLKRVLLELGGKAPIVVLKDADLDGAAAAASFGAFFHQGQICMSTERIVVDRTVADSLVEKLTERARALPIGDPRDQSTAIGPLVIQAAVERVSGLVDDAVANGAKMLSGGRPDGPCFPPTVLVDVTPKMRLYSEESFGPLVAMIPVDGIGEAVRVANDSEYGLSAAVFSKDVAAALELAQRIESGICHINDTTVHDEPQMPFGGVRPAASRASADARHSRNSPNCAGSPFRNSPANTQFDRRPSNLPTRPTIAQERSPKNLGLATQHFRDHEHRATRSRRFSAFRTSAPLSGRPERQPTAGFSGGDAQQRSCGVALAFSHQAKEAARDADAPDARR